MLGMEEAEDWKAKDQDSYQEGAPEQVKAEGRRFAIGSTTKKSIILQKDNDYKSTPTPAEDDESLAYLQLQPKD